MIGFSTSIVEISKSENIITVQGNANNIGGFIGSAQFVMLSDLEIEVFATGGFRTAGVIGYAADSLNAENLSVNCTISSN